MTDVRTRLTRFAEADPGPRGGLDDVYARASHRRAVRRIAAGSVAAIVAIAGFVLALKAFDGARPEPRPTSLGPINVSSLEQVWRVEVEDGQAIYGVVQDAERLFVPTTTGIVAYPKTCAAPGAPAWSIQLPSPPRDARDAIQLAAGDGFVVAVRGDLLVAVP